MWEGSSAALPMVETSTISAPNMGGHFTTINPIRRAPHASVFQLVDTILVFTPLLWATSTNHSVPCLGPSFNTRLPLPLPLHTTTNPNRTNPLTLCFKHQKFQLKLKTHVDTLTLIVFTPLLWATSTYNSEPFGPSSNT
mmetsp:Transcript_28215/g.86214  ORF Transcript_28215/g.86214 Transcript_28215/m.86214 type:complete len:139 (-) Transcript_28215:336-752(-)